MLANDVPAALPEALPTLPTLWMLVAVADKLMRGVITPVLHVSLS